MASWIAYAVLGVGFVAFGTWHFRCVVTHEGISGYDLLLRPQSLAWSEIAGARVRLIPPFRYLEISANASSILVPSVLRTPDTFVEALLEMAPDGSPVIGPARELFGGRGAAFYENAPVKPVDD